MTLAVAAPVSATLGRAWLAARMNGLLDKSVAFWIFSGSVVIAEPSPYEFAFFIVLGVSLFASKFAFKREALGIAVLWLAFVPFALIAAFPAKYTPTSETMIFEFVTIFLMFTSVWVASYVAEAPQERVRLIVNAYIATAVISALVGTLGYLGVIPGHDLFTRSMRAKALFKDPNVFGPFLILPAMYALQRVLLGTPRRAIIAGATFLILVIGIFVSFSRAAWGNVIAVGMAVYILCFFLVANAKEKVRMLLMAMVGLALLGVAFAGLLSIPKVQELFSVRAQATQDYDEGSTGRFGRQAYAFDLALAHPWGIGPYEFRNLRVVEEPHDAYVDALHVYGWGGGLVFWLFLAITSWRGIRFLFIPSPNRLLLIPAIAVFIGLVVEAAIIDLDHWRHLWLVGGLIWGVTAGYKRLYAGNGGRLAALV